MGEKPLGAGEHPPSLIFLRKVHWYQDTLFYEFLGCNGEILVRSIPESSYSGKSRRQVVIQELANQNIE